MTLTRYPVVTSTQRAGAQAANALAWLCFDPKRFLNMAAQVLF